MRRVLLASVEQPSEVGTWDECPVASCLQESEAGIEMNWKLGRQEPSGTNCSTGPDGDDAGDARHG